MHRFLSTKQAQMTRYVTLENVETGTMDYCFDNSDFPGGEYEGFYFMEEGKTYNCKIGLFGDIHPETGGTKVLCRVIREDVLVGKRHRVEVRVGKDIYYVPRKEVEERLENGAFYYYYTRKDLIQVDDVVNRYCLMEW